MEPSKLVRFSFFVSWHINLYGLFDAKAILDKEFHIFPNGLSSKVNKIVLMKFEPAYFEAVVHHFGHYTIGMTPYIMRRELIPTRTLIYKN